LLGAALRIRDRDSDLGVTGERLLRLHEERDGFRQIVIEVMPQPFEAAGERIDTVAVPSVLAVYNWPKNSDRYRRVERFVQYLFNRWDKLTQPPFHPRWRDVNLAATVPGWTRFSVSDEMLRRAPSGSGDQAIARDFETYMGREVRAAPRNEAERDAVFRQFMLWREQRQR